MLTHQAICDRTNKEGEIENGRNSSKQTVPDGQIVIEDRALYNGHFQLQRPRKSSMRNSSEVVKEIREELKNIDDQIRNHVLLNRLREKKVDLNALKAFPGHQYHIINSDLRSVAMMVHRFGKPSEQSFFKQVLEGETEALSSILVLAKKFGMTEEDLQRHPLVPEGFAYATYMCWLSTYASAAEIVAGFLVNFAAWGDNCGQMSQSLKDHYGFNQADTVFLDAFANMPSFETIALQIIQDGLNEGIDPARVHRAVYLFQGYERMFWDTMAKVAHVV